MRRNLTRHRRVCTPRSPFRCDGPHGCASRTSSSRLSAGTAFRAILRNSLHPTIKAQRQTKGDADFSASAGGPRGISRNCSILLRRKGRFPDLLSSGIPSVSPKMRRVEGAPAFTAEWRLDLGCKRESLAGIRLAPSAKSNLGLPIELYAPVLTVAPWQKHPVVSAYGTGCHCARRSLPASEPVLP